MIDVMKKVVLLILLLSACCSCSDRRSILMALDQSASLMTERPDSALTIIRGIDAAQIRKTSTKARYSLLYSQALDKNYIDVKNDSLIRIAADFYQGKGTAKEQFQSYYYLGRVQQNTEDYQLALQSFLKAEVLLVQLGNDYLSGLLYSSMADLNLAQNSFDRAMSYYKKSYNSYERSERHKHRINTLIHIAHLNVLQGQYEKAIANYNTAYSDAERMGYEDLQNDCIKSLIGTYCDLSNIPAAKKYMYQWMAIKDDFDVHDHCTFSQVYLYDNKPDSAEYYAHKMLAIDDVNTERIIAANDLLSSAAFSKGNFKQAYILSQEYHALKDSLYLEHMNNSVAEAELQYKDERLSYELYRSTINRRTIYATIFTSIFMLCGISFIYHRRHKQQQEKIREYFALIDNLSETKNARNTRVANLFNTRFMVLKELAMTYYEYGNTSALEKKVKAILSEKIMNISVIEDLENTLNQEYDNVIAEYRAEYPKCSNDFIKLLCLLYAGFSPQEICVITNESLSAIYMRKSRLKKKIISSMMSNKDEILEILS